MTIAQVLQQKTKSSDTDKQNAMLAYYTLHTIHVNVNSSLVYYAEIAKQWNVRYSWWSVTLLQTGHMIITVTLIKTQNVAISQL